MKKIVMLCSALVLGVWPEAQASLWEIEAYTNEKEIGVTSKTSLVAITERMNKLNSVSTVDAKRVYRWLYDYWLSDPKRWSNDGKKSTFGNIQGYVNQDYLVETEKELKMDNDGNYILEKNEIGNKDKNYFSQNADGDYILDWTNTFNLMLKKIENLLPEAAANNGATVNDEDDEVEKKTPEQIDQDTAAEAARVIRANNLKTDKENEATWNYTFETYESGNTFAGYIKTDENGNSTLKTTAQKRIESEMLAQKQADEVEAQRAAQAVNASNQKTEAETKATWANTFDVDNNGYITKDDSGNPKLKSEATNRIESELLAQKQANKEEIAKTLLAQEQALETGKQTTVATLKSLRIVDKDGKISADETSKQLYINPKADAWINYDLVNAQHEVQLATEEQRIRHALELSQVQVIENMGTAISEMEASLFADSPNIDSLTPFDLAYLSAVMEDAGVTVDDDFIVGMKRVWRSVANNMSEHYVAKERKDEDGNSLVDPNALTNADVAILLLDHFSKTNTVQTSGIWDLHDRTLLPNMQGLLKKFSDTKPLNDKIEETKRKMTFHLNLVARALQEIAVEENLEPNKGGTATIKDIWFHSFRQYMLQAFREAFSLIKEQHKEDREDWLASLMPDTKTAGIITHEDDPETNKKDIQWASDLTPCDATKPVAD